MTEATTQTISEATSSEVIVHTPEEVAKAVIKGRLPPPGPGKGKEGFEALRKGRESERQITKEDVEKAGEIMDEELRRRAEEILTNLRDTALYLQAVERIQKEGLTEAAKRKVFQELFGQGVNREQIKAIEDRVINFLSAQPAIRNLFRGKNEKEIRKALSTLIATQPQFREALVRMTKDALAGFESLPKVSEESEELKRKENELGEVTKSNEELSNILGIKPDELRKIIGDQVDGELSLILDQIRRAKEELLSKSSENFSSDAFILVESGGSKALTIIDQKIANIEEQLRSIEIQLTSHYQQMTGGGKTIDSDFAKEGERIRAKKSELERQKDLLTARRELVDKALNNIQTNSNDSSSILKQIDQLVELRYEIDLVKQGKDLDVIALRIKKYLANIGKIESLKKEIRQEEAKAPKKQKELAVRKAAERDLVEGLEAVANDSFVEFLEEKAREMAKHDEEKRNTESDEALRRFDEALSKRYVEFSPSARKYIHHRYQTGQDMRLLALGDEGGKIIVARILFNDNTLTSLGALKPQQLSQVEKVYQQRAADLRKRLMTDYFRQRTFFDRSFIKFGKWFSKEVLFEGGFGDLRITDAEWEEIGRHFGQEVDTALQASKQGQEVLRQLKEKGININWNLKWLLYILLGLGAVGTIFGVKALTGL
jgi:DNA-directed RNA polymerase subunit F